MTQHRLLGICRTLTVLALPMLFAGCIKRAEMIAVMPDGGVELITQINGNRDDVLGGSELNGKVGDPPPSADSGWTIYNMETKQSFKIGEKNDSDNNNDSDEDEDEINLLATMSLKPGAQIPQTYAAKNAKGADAATRFITTLEIEKTTDGTYYHFKRKYIQRRWAPFEYHRKRILESDEIKKLMGNNPEAMSARDRETVITAMIDVESEQLIELLGLAIEDGNKNVPQLARLAAVKRIREITSEPELNQKVMAAMMTTNGTQDTTELEQDLHRRVDAAVAKSLTDAGTLNAVASATVHSMQAFRRKLQVSEDLEDENWFVQVILPGSIIAYNGTENPESIDPADLENTGDDSDDDPSSVVARMLGKKLKPHIDTSGFQTYTWGFEFDAICDHDVVLMATSFVPNEK